MSNVSLRGRLSRHLAVAATVAAGAAGAASADVVYFGDQNLIINSTFRRSVPQRPHRCVQHHRRRRQHRRGRLAHQSLRHDQPQLVPARTGTGYLEDRHGALANLAVGTLIDGSGTFSSCGASTNLTLNGTSIVGFRFTLDGGTHYGWFRLSLSDTYGGQPRSIVDWAYESVAGAAIDAGAIPAPGAVALLGLAGLAGSRRRRG